MSISQYPEHLNPFAEESKQHKSGLRIGGSFRDFTKTLRKSFRIKKKDKYHDHDVEIRKRNPETIRPFPMSYPNGNNLSQPDQLTPALPRSRFQERLSKSPTYHPTQSSSSRRGLNPFDECEEDNEIKIGTTRRRGKKRAPLPPKSLSSQNINDSYLSLPHSSNWSLTSAADTEISYSTENVSDAGSEIDRVSMSDKFVDFNKEMAKLNDDSNNNIIATKDKDIVIPDLVISCPNSDTESTQSKDCTTKADGKREEHNEEGITAKKEIEATDGQKRGDRQEDKKEEIKQEVKKEDVRDQEEIKEYEGKQEEKKEYERKQEEKEEDERKQEVKKSAPIAIQEDEIPHIDDDSDSSEVIVVTDITCNLKNPDGIDDMILYHEKKSLYITGSRDELNNSNNNNTTYTDHVSLYITGSKEQLDSSNNNYEICDKTESEQNDDDGNMPIPKQRKHKLTRSLLLGTQETEIM